MAQPAGCQVFAGCAALLALAVAGCTAVPVRGPAADQALAQLQRDGARTARVPSAQPSGATIAAQPPQPAPAVAAAPQPTAPVSSRRTSPPRAAAAPVAEPITQVSGNDEDGSVQALAANAAEPVAKTAAPSPAPQADAESAADAPPTPAAYTFSLGNVLQLADAQNPNVALARERINEAYARVERSETLWLPSLRAGLNYNHHEGSIQDVAGNVFQTTRSSFYGGFGANAVGAGSPAVPGVVAQFHLTDAIFQPKIAAHQASSRQYGATAARNDVLRDAAVAYLELLRAEQGLAVAHEALENTRKLAAVTQQFAETGQGLQSDYQRMQAEVAVRQDQVVSSVEAVQVASARLAQVLHADPAVRIVSGEPTVAPLDILQLDGAAAAYVATALSRRPELAEQKHLVCEAVERLRREKYAPLVPSVLLGLSYGGLGGGLGSSIINSSDRWDADAVAYWEVRNFGMGERAARGEASSVMRQAQMRELAALDRVAREVVEAHTQVTERQKRIEVAQGGIAAAERSYALNLQRIENGQGLPIEALQSIQALATARRTYLNAVVDYNIAQFELARAIGWFVET